MADKMDVCRDMDAIDARFTTVLSTLGVIAWAVNEQFQSCQNDFEACLGAALDGVYEAFDALQNDYQTMVNKVQHTLKEGAENGKEQSRTRRGKSPQEGCHP